MPKNYIYDIDYDEVTRLREEEELTWPVIGERIGAPHKILNIGYHRRKKPGFVPRNLPIVLTNMDAAYIAGLIDGEGSITIAESGQDFRLSLTITNTYRPVLEWVQERTGGSLASRRNDKNRRPIHVLSINNKRVTQILRKIAPYMIIKRQQAQIALDFQLTKGWQERTDEILEKRAGYKERISQAKQYYFPVQPRVTKPPR